MYQNSILKRRYKAKHPHVRISPITKQHCRVALTDSVSTINHSRAVNFYIRKFQNHHIDRIFCFTLIGISTRNDILYIHLRTNLNGILCIHRASPNIGFIPTVIFGTLANKHRCITLTNGVLSVNHIRASYPYLWQSMHHNIYRIFRLTFIGIGTSNDIFNVYFRTDLNGILCIHRTGPYIRFIPSIIFSSFSYQHSGIALTDGILTIHHIRTCDSHFRQGIYHHIHRIFRLTFIGISTSNYIADISHRTYLYRIFCFHGVRPYIRLTPTIIFSSFSHKHRGIALTNGILAVHHIRTRNFHFG